MSERCRNCNHAIVKDKDNKWIHKSLLHNDNCDCRVPAEWILFGRYK